MRLAKGRESHGQHTAPFCARTVLGWSNSLQTHFTDKKLEAQKMLGYLSKVAKLKSGGFKLRSNSKALFFSHLAQKKYDARGQLSNLAL